jgi:hypothetical protein
MSIEIIGSQSDQMSNQFMFKIPDGLPNGGDVGELEVRMNKSIELPDMKHGTYERSWRGDKIQKSNKVVETSKELNFELVCDQRWKVAQDILDWFGGVYDSKTYTWIPEERLRKDIAILAQDENNSVAKILWYRGFLLTGAKISAFDHTGAEPISITVSGSFIRFETE